MYDMTRINTEVRVDKKSNKAIKGFVDFLKKNSVVTLALGVVIGQATKDVVNKLVDGIITPGIQILLPKMEIQDLVVEVDGAEFRIGEFIDSLIQMTIIMLIIYIVFGLLFKNPTVIKKKKSKKK